MRARAAVATTMLCLLRSAIALLATAVALSYGLELMQALLDAGLPWRQLTANRNLNGLVLSLRVIGVIVGCYIAARFVDSWNRRTAAGDLQRLLRRPKALPSALRNLPSAPSTARSTVGAL